MARNQIRKYLCDTRNSPPLKRQQGFTNFGNK